MAASVLALGLAACAAIPGGPRLAQPKPLQSYADQASFAARPADWPSVQWWNAYDDPQLSALIETALKGSPTLAEARARLRGAAAAAETARSATLPSLSGNASIAEAEQSRATGFPPFIQQLLPKGFHDTGQLALDASLDLDLFGKNRDALAAAVSEKAAVRTDLAEAKL
ncbi:MAG: TolC family protein, partial [Caulobacteraceae bacterium]